MKDEEHPMKAIVNLSRIWHRIIENKMSDLSLSSIQSRLLGYLYFQYREGKPVFQRELESEFQIRRSSITSVIQLMERKGLLERIPVPGDARQKELRLTEAGVDLQEAVIRRLDELEGLVNGSLSQEEKQVWFSCIRKVETRLKEAEHD